MNIPVNFKINFLWGDQAFIKSEWGSINYLVGSNGSGKSLFIDRLREFITGTPNFPFRYLHSDRLVDWTRQSNRVYSNTQLNRGLDTSWVSDIKNASKVRGDVHDAFVLLRDNLDVRIKVEATLSQLINRKVILDESSGFLKPLIQKGKDVQYSFQENESHGLKEMITLVTLLHDESYKCFIIDEPELHLHPQFQSFLMQEIRKHAGDPNTDPTKKCFFIVTHSPYIVDVRTIEELKNCVVFQPHKLPAYIDQLDPDDEYRLNQLLPRLNTHHKQFFFSTKPVFVEGYTDQQLFSLIQEKRGKFIGSSGSTFIDVNGKEELDLFFRLCKKLRIDCQIITDLDALLDGKLRQSLASDERCQNSIREKGLGFDFVRGLSEVHQKLDECILEFESKFPSIKEPSIKLKMLHEYIISKNTIVEKKYPFLLGIQLIGNELVDMFPQLKDSISFISGRINNLIVTTKEAGVFILPKGELENYLGVENPFNITDKMKSVVFINERDYLIKNNPTENEMMNKYGDLLKILDIAIVTTKVDYKQSLQHYIRDLIYAIQSVSVDNSVSNLQEFLIDSKVNYNFYKPIVEIVNYERVNSSFKCQMKIKKFDDIPERTMEFDSEFNPTKFVIP